jgi:hypothetical protein
MEKRSPSTKNFWTFLMIKNNNIILGVILKLICKPLPLRDEMSFIFIEFSLIKM